MDEPRKVTLKDVDVMMCYLCNKKSPVDQIDLFYRKNRGAELLPLHQIKDDFISEEHCIPDFILKTYGKCPVSMWQMKYTGANRLVGRIIIDAVKANYKTPKQAKRKRTRDEYQRMKTIIDNQVTHNNLDRVVTEEEASKMFQQVLDEAKAKL